MHEQSSTQAREGTKDVLTVGELAEYLRVHPSTIYRLLRKHEIPAFKVGSDWRFNLVSIDRWRIDLESNEPEANPRLAQ
jgi:excisionase family DNA binding protein